MNKLRVFFDGACPLCKKEISLYQKADIQKNIDWCDISQNDATLYLPLERQILLARFHVQLPDGALKSGSRAFIAMWEELPRWWVLAKICKAPGIPVLLDLGYVFFLRLRPALQRLFR